MFGSEIIFVTRLAGKSFCGAGKFRLKNKIGSIYYSQSVKTSFPELYLWGDDDEIDDCCCSVRRCFPHAFRRCRRGSARRRSEVL